MEPENISNIKKLALLAMFSDDLLIDYLVLKGGNVLDLIYGVATRSSVDLDFSIENDFPEDLKCEIEDRIKTALTLTFREQGYLVFDIDLTERPKQVTTDMQDFWGGYRIEFKVIRYDEFVKIEYDKGKVRQRALELGYGHKKSFKIEISKFEYCKAKRPKEVDGRTIYIYTPEMMIFEKLRAICQQMPEYAKIVKNPSQSARARDFYDIYVIIDSFNIDLASLESIEIMQNIFAAKHVPLRLMENIHKYREYHRPDFISVKDAIKPGIDVKPFDYYFDYVLVNCVNKLKPFWEEQTPSL